MILILSLPLRIIEEVCLCIPRNEVDSKTIISDLCYSLNELKKQVKSLSNNNNILFIIPNLHTFCPGGLTFPNIYFISFFNFFENKNICK